MLDGIVAQSKYPLGFHITPLKGLLNDPNGLIYFNGKYHVFYQWNPVDTTHENKAWGHMTSRDMVHWQREEVALVPSEFYDKDGVYSGSAIEYKGKLYLFYTGTAVESDGKKSYQCLAVSEDGVYFEKKGPIMIHPEGYTRHLRDPKVWYQEDENLWYLVLGAQRNSEEGTVLVYTSPNLDEWQSKGELLTQADLDLFAQKAYMWECPDVFELNQQWFLLFSPQGFKENGDRYQNVFHTVYCPLKKEGSHFSVKNHALDELDWGFEFYAPQTFVAPDNRRILYGWMGVMASEKEQSMPTVTEGWAHGLTIPREVTEKDGKLYQTPIKELAVLRKTKEIFELNAPWCYLSSNLQAEVQLIFSEISTDFSIQFKKTTGLIYDAAEQRLHLQRKNWVTGEIESRQITLQEPLQSLRLYLDGSSLELFANEGVAVATARYFEEGSLTIAYQGQNVGSAVVYALNL